MADYSPRRARVSLALWIGLIVFVVVPWYAPQSHAHWAQAGWIPFVSPPIKARDIIANVLFYVPFGYLVVRLRPPQDVRQHAAQAIRTAVLAALLLSAATEVSQTFSHRRFTSMTDLVCNVAGAACGAVWAVRRAKPTARRVRR